MPTTILLTFVIFALFLAGTGVYMMLTKQSKRRERLQQIVMGQTAYTKNSKVSSADQKRADIAKKLKEQEDGTKSAKKKKNNLRELLMQTGKSITVKQFMIYSAALSAVMFLIGKAAGFGLFVCIMLAIIGFFGIPRMVIRHMRLKRQKKFLEEFADALEATVRMLKAGMPVSEAISMVAKEYTGPVGEEMARIYDEQKMGTSLPDAVMHATVRMPLTEMQMFATGISIQAQTGSSLSDILMNLANVIRARFRLKRKIKSLSSEAKASAMIIGCLPLFVGGGIYLIEPEYIGVMFIYPVGKMMLTGAAIWMGFGILAMKMMINFKV